MKTNIVRRILITKLVSPSPCLINSFSRLFLGTFECNILFVRNGIDSNQIELN